MPRSLKDRRRASPDAAAGRSSPDNGDVLLAKRVEQRLVGILQGAQEEIALEIGLEFAQALQPALDLFVERADMQRQQAMQVNFAALILGEADPLLSRGSVRRAVPSSSMSTMAVPVDLCRSLE